MSNQPHPLPPDLPPSPNAARQQPPPKPDHTGLAVPVDAPEDLTADDGGEGLLSGLPRETSVDHTTAAPDPHREPPDHDA
jgi:hypothetical protein